MHLSRYLKIFPAQNQPGHFLLYSTLRGSLVSLPAETLEKLRGGAVPPPEGETLARLGMLVPDPEAEKERMRGILERVNSRSDHFKAMVVLNLDCNLDCGYCYEGGFRGEHYMSAATADLLVETLLRERIDRGEHVTLSFYGGEPLLSMDLIERISHPLARRASEKGVRYGFNLVTNGTLLDRATAKRLVPLGLNAAKVTLDGPPEVHDKERPYASGAGSFDVILENIAVVWDLVPLTLGGNFRESTYRQFPALLDLLVSSGVTPEKLKLVQFTPVTPQAGCSECSSGCASSDAPWLIEALLFLREEILRRGFRTSGPSVSACLVELEDNIVVSWEGAYYKCPAFMGWEGLSVGNLHEGMGEYRSSHCIGNWQVDACLDCAYLPICFGGCRFLNMVQGKGMDQPDCKREFLDATLERFIKQDRTYRRPAPLSP